MFGPAGPLVMRVMKDLAQQQRGGGRVLTGFRSLRSKTFVEEIETVRAIVECAGRIGALDDLQVDDDGRRFRCRVSGWEGDQTRGRAAIKKAEQRAVPSEGDMSPPCPDASEDDAVDGPDECEPANSVPLEGDVSPPSDTPIERLGATTPPVVPSEGDVSGSVPLNRHDQNIEEQQLEPAAPVEPDRLDAARTRLRSEQVTLVFDAWVKATERDAARTKLTADRRRRIVKALASHGLDDCLAAVTNIGLDEWARGANDRGRRFDDIEHALGTAARLERWRDQTPRPSAPQGRDARRARGAAALTTLLSPTTNGAPS